MQNKSIDVIGLGNALLDLTIYVEDDFLKKLGLTKGHMALVDEETYLGILKTIAELDAKKSSGGSSSNTIKGVTILGGKSAFMGMIGNDSYGDKYLEELKHAGVEGLLSRTDKNTGVAITFITKDKERTFATYLGASLSFTEDNVNEKSIENSKILHIEGFFLEPPQHRMAALKAMNIAKKYGTKISVDLSDPGLIQRNKEFFTEVLHKYVDIVFVNEHEAKAFTNEEEEAAVHHLSKYCEYSIVKLGPKGSLIKHNETVHKIPIHTVTVMNTNGAGDAYAAGILYGISNNISLDRSGMIASMISSKVVGVEEATLDYSLKDHVERMLK